MKKHEKEKENVKKLKEDIKGKENEQGSEKSKKKTNK